VNKSIKKINKNTNCTVLENEIEFDEDLYLNKEKISIITSIKFNYKYKNDLDLNNI
jgi:hypothetical protein